jgi:transcriptional regulator with XRE-family HTH domain
MADMPSRPPPPSSRETALLAQLGGRIRLARLRRRLGTAAVSATAGISRSSVYKVEAGDPGATLGAYVRVLAALGLEGDLDAIAAEDPAGRLLQDLGLGGRVRAGKAKPRLPRPPSLTPAARTVARTAAQPPRDLGSTEREAGQVRAPARRLARPFEDDEIL